MVEENEKAPQPANNGGKREADAEYCYDSQLANNYYDDSQLTNNYYDDSQLANNRCTYEANAGEAVDVGHIRVVPYEIITINELEIKQKINEHASVTLKGIMRPDVVNGYLNDTRQEKTIKISQVNDSGAQVRIFFDGIVTKFQTEYLNGVHNVEINALSYTSLLDVKKELRTFQSGYELNNLFRDFNRQYNIFIISTLALKILNQEFKMQYQETNWEFLKRMAPIFDAVLIPNASENQLNFLDVNSKRDRQRQRQKLTVVSFDSDIQNLADYYTINGNQKNSNILMNNFIFRNISSYQYAIVGEEVTLNIGGDYLVIIEIKTTLSGGQLKHSYTLCNSLVLFAKVQIFNNQIAGTSLFGEVVGVKQDKVQVKFDIDDCREAPNANQQNVTNANCNAISRSDNQGYFWFPYYSIYASEKNIGWYCMPEIGDEARIYFPNHSEKNGFVISSFKKGTYTPLLSNNSTAKYTQPPNANKNQTVNPEEKLLIAHGKKLILAPDYILIDGDGGKIILHDTNGLGILTKGKKNIEFQADKCIEFTAENIVGEATKMVEFVCGKEKIIMRKKQIETTGTEIKFFV